MALADESLRCVVMSSLSVVYPSLKKVFFVAIENIQMALVYCNTRSLSLMSAMFITQCRIDTHFVIKIADFGLSEDVYCRNYFKQGNGATVKLPVKWMAPESLQDGVFSDKTDVVSY